MKFEFAVESQMKGIVVGRSRMNESFLNIHIIIADSLRIIQIVRINQNKKNITGSYSADREWGGDDATIYDHLGFRAGCWCLPSNLKLFFWLEWRHKTL